MPRAADLPAFETAHTVTLSPPASLGAKKGVGVGATIGAPPAVLGAVLDARAPFGVTGLDMPLTPEKVGRAIRSGRGGGGPAPA